MNKTVISSMIGIMFIITSFMGFIQGDEVAHVIALSYVWLCIIFGFSLIFVPDETVVKCFQKGPSIPRAVDITLDMAVAIMLLVGEHNHWIIALLFIGHIVLINEGFKAAKKQEEKKLSEEKLDFNFNGK